MSRSVVFRTPGLMDVRSFTSFGVNVKPNTESPIGYFGTGLKYAIAVLVRHGLKITVYIGREKYTFYLKQEKFREKNFDFIRMKKESWWPEGLRFFKPKYEELPFTTEFGKNWKLWQAFRELYTNTLDENGDTLVVNSPEEVTNRTQVTDSDGLRDFVDVEQTLIVVEGEQFVQEFYDKDRNFLPDGLRQRDSTERLQVFDRPSNHIYYRGMRVYDLDKPSTLTYNFLCDVKLTEDRTAASPYTLQDEISKYLLACEEEARLTKVLHEKDSYEANINYSWAYRAPSSTFSRVVQAARPANATAAAVVRTYEPRKVVENPLSSYPRPWALHPVGDKDYAVLDAYNKLVMRFGSDLSTEAVRYIMALLQKDLDDDEFDQWIRERPQDLMVTDPEAEDEIREALGEDSVPMSVLPSDSSDDGWMPF